MIVLLSPDTPPALADVDRLDRLHAESRGPLAEILTSPLCSVADDEHVWLDIATARAAGVAASDDPDFQSKFDQMVAYAVSKGWADEAGTRVRAHVEITGVTP